MYAINDQKYVLAGLLKYPNLYFDIGTIITDLDFNDKYNINRTIFQIIRKRIVKDEPLDEVLIASDFLSIKLSFSDQFDIKEYLGSLKLVQVSEKGVLEYARNLKNATVRREICELAEKLILELKSEKAKKFSYDETIKLAEGLVYGKISTYELAKEPQDLFDGMEALLENEEYAEESGLIPPYENYRRMFGGFQEGDIYAFLGRPKSGKGTLLMDILFKSCVKQNNAKGLYLDTEMRTDEVQRRTLSNITGINEWYLHDKRWTKNKEMADTVRKTWPFIKEFFNHVDHLYVEGLPIDQIVSISRRWFLKKVGKGNKAIGCYDYLKLTGETVSDSVKEYHIIGNKVNAIKALAQELKMPWLTSCQLNRSNENRQNSSKLSDDGSAIAQSDRLAWFGSFVGIFRKKLPDELAFDGAKFGSHKLIPLFARKLGQYAEEYINPIKVQDGTGFKFVPNFINFDVHNFNVTECGTLRDIIKFQSQGISLNSDEEIDTDF